MLSTLLNVENEETLRDLFCLALSIYFAYDSHDFVFLEFDELIIITPDKLSCLSYPMEENQRKTL